MAGVEDEPKKISAIHEKNGYFLPASLVNKLIISIITAIFLVGGYMISWAYSDVAWKADQEKLIDRLDNKLLALDTKIVALPPTWLTSEVALHRQQIRDIQISITKLETAHQNGKEHR